MHFLSRAIISCNVSQAISSQVCHSYFSWCKNRLHPQLGLRCAWLLKHFEAGAKHILSQKHTLSQVWACASSPENAYPILAWLKLLIMDDWDNVPPLTSTRSVETLLTQVEQGENCTETAISGKIDDHVLPPFDTSISCKELVSYKIDELSATKMCSMNLCEPIMPIAMEYRVLDFPEDIKSDNMIAKALSWNKGG